MVALGGLAALPPEEVIYFRCVNDDTGRRLTGEHRYKLRLPPGGLACDAFRSLTMYQIEPDGRRFWCPIRSVVT